MPRRITASSVRRDVALTIAFVIVAEAIVLAIVLFAPGLFKVIGAICLITVPIGGMMMVRATLKKAKARERYNLMILAQLQDANFIPAWDVTSFTAADTIFGVEAEAWFEALCFQTIDSSSFDADAKVLQTYYVKLLSEVKKFMEAKWKWSDDEFAKPRTVLANYGSLSGTLAWLDELASVFNERATDGPSLTWDRAILEHKKSSHMSGASTQYRLETACNPRVLESEIGRLSN